MKLIRCHRDICDCLSKLQVMLNKLCMCLRFPKIPVILLSFSQIGQKHIRQMNI